MPADFHRTPLAVSILEVVEEIEMEAHNMLGNPRIPGDEPDELFHDEDAQMEALLCLRGAARNLVDLCDDGLEVVYGPAVAS